MERRHKVKQEEAASFAQRVEDLVDAEDGELGERAYGVELFVVHRDPNATFFLRYGDHGVGVR